MDGKRHGRAERYATEAQIQQAIVNYLQALGWYVIVTDAGEAARASRQRHRQGRMRPGTPDLVALKDGRGVLIEVKRPRGRLTARQKWEHDVAKSRGVPVLVARSVEDVERCLEEVERERM